MPSTTQVPFKTISQFLKRYHENSTIKGYRTALVKFLNYIYDVPETRRVGGDKSKPDLEFYDRKSLEYLRSPRDYSGDIAEFVASLGPVSPSLKRSSKSVVLLWLAANKIFLHPLETRGIKTSGRARTRDRIPTVEEIRRILDHGDLQIRTYILLLSSTGMRPSEALSLKWCDIDEKRGAIYLRPECTKTGEGRICFMSLEAMDLYSEWRVYYPQYLKIRDVRANKPHDDASECVFPVVYRSILKKFNLALEKAGLGEKDPSTGRAVIHLHGMRKRFRTLLPQGGASVDVTEILMGHEGYLTGSYLRLTDADLERAYREAEHELWIYRTKPINDEKLQRLKREKDELEDKFGGQIAEIQRQLNALAKMQRDGGA